MQGLYIWVLFAYYVYVCFCHWCLVFMLSNIKRRDNGNRTVGRFSIWDVVLLVYGFPIYSRPSYLYDGNPIPGKTVFILRRGPDTVFTKGILCIPKEIMSYTARELLSIKKIVFVRGIHRCPRDYLWVSLTKGQFCGKRFYVTSSCLAEIYQI